MLSHLRRSSRALLACVLLCAGSVPVASSSGNPGTACEDLRLWAKSYERLAPTLDELARFDRARRVAIFNAVRPEVRAALWQDQLSRFSGRADLSAAQRALLVEARTLAVPAVYRRDVRAQEAVDAFWTRAQEAFPRPEHQRVFFDLGAVVSGDRPAQRTNATADDFCECNTSHPWPQCGGAFCNSAACTSWVGCGSMGNKECNGMCDW